MKIIPKQRQSGTTLLEVVVTIVIISIGLLGLAGLQLNSMKFQKSASQRSEAVQSAYDLSERMRANGAGVSQSIEQRAAGAPRPAGRPRCAGEPARNDGR